MEVCQGQRLHWLPLSVVSSVMKAAIIAEKRIITLIIIDTDVR
jgi:hypothetical protein